MELLPLTWYFQPPIDFEHKEYVLYSYLQKVDESFLKRKLSPHLLHIERMLKELETFHNNIESIWDLFEKRKYKYFDNPLLEGTKNDNIDVIVDIVEFSIPHFDSRLVHGQKIFKKYNQILY